MRMQNFAGSVYERLAIRRGLVASGVGAATIGGATWAGKELSARMPTATAPTWRAVAMGGIDGAVQGAAAGCVAGAVGGLVTAGALSGVGCLAAGLGAAVVGGFFGARGAMVNLDEGGQVKIPVGDLNELIRLAGSQAAMSTLSARSQSSLKPCPTSQAQVNDFVATYGDGVQFACSGGNGFQVGQILTMKYAFSSQTNTNTIFTSDNKPVYVNDINCRGVLLPSLIQWSGCSSIPINFARLAGSTQVNTTNATAIAVFVGSSVHSLTGENYADYAKTITPIASAPSWASVLGPQINASANQLKLSNEALAGMLNALHKQMTIDGNLPYGVPNYDPSDPITLADVQQVKNDFPASTPLVGDLVRPYNIPGREPVGGTAGSPVAAPTDVNVVSGNPSTSPTTVTATLDLGDKGDSTLPTASQTAEIPMFDQIQDGINPFRNLDIQWPSSQCPIYPIDANFFGRQSHWEIDFHCTVFADDGYPRMLLGMFIIFCCTLAGVRTFLKA